MEKEMSGSQNMCPTDGGKNALLLLYLKNSFKILIFQEIKQETNFLLL